MLLALIAALSCSLAFADGASANIPAGEDQYLEQVPNGGGERGDKSKVDLVSSLGGENGVVSARDVRRAAAKNQRADRRRSAKGADGDPGEAALPGGSDPVTGVLASATLGPFSRGTSFVLLALAVALAASAFASRTLRSRP